MILLASGADSMYSPGKVKIYHRIHEKYLECLDISLQHIIIRSNNSMLDDTTYISSHILPSMVFGDMLPTTACSTRSARRLN